MATQITVLPEPPSRGDASTFAARGDALLGALPAFVSEANLLAAEVWAAYGAVLSNTAAAIAKGTSTTSVTIGTGAKSFTTQSGKGFVAGQPVLISSAASRANWMWGIVSAYASTTLDVTVSLVGGSGSLADWDILIAAVPGSVIVTDFDASGTWTKAATTRAIYVMCLGAGGGGGGVHNSTGKGASGGGGGGACSEMWLAASEASATETITVGAGGPGGGSATSGTAGGYSSFGTRVKAYGGGGGGGVNSSGTGGAGGGGGGAAGGVGESALVINTGSFTRGGSGGLVVQDSTALTTANSSGTAGTDGYGHKGASGGCGVASGGTVAGAGGGADWGGASGGGGSATTASGFGGKGGSSLMGGHGGGGGGSGSGGNGGGGVGVSRNPVIAAAVALGGAAGANANGTAGGIACGGGGCITTAATARTGGAGGRGHVRVIEFGF